MTSICRTLALCLFALLAAAPAARRPPARSRGAGRKPKSKLKPHTLPHFEEFCRRFIVLDSGDPFVVEPFQRLILKGFFAGVTEILVLLPKKNGKTTLLAALALYHLIYTRDARCYIAASAKDQAKVMYEQACGFLERKDEKTGKLLPGPKALQKKLVLRKGTKEIRNRNDSGFIWVCSGDVNTVDGVIVTLGLVDELHRHKDGGQLYGVLVDGTGPRDGQVMTISTPGESLRSVLGRALQTALKFPGVKKVGKYTYARSPGGDFELHQWGLDDDDDREDLELVKQANPLSNVTVEKLAIRKKSPFMTPSRWARFGCGVWMEGEDAALSRLDIAQCQQKWKPLPRGSEVYLGLDIGWRWDTTAITPLMVLDEETRRVRYGTPRILTPPRDGTAMRRKAIIQAILDFGVIDGYVIKAVVFDRNAEGEGVAQELEDKHGIEVIEHSQDPAPMADACMGLAEGIGEQTVEIPPDADEFVAHLLAAVAKTTSGEKWRFVKPAKTGAARKKGQQDSDDVIVIDAAIAAAMVRRTALADSEPPPPPPDDLLNYKIGMV